MFHFPAFPPHCLCVQQWVTAHDDCRVSPFGNPRSVPGASIGSWCQGIHRAPLKTWPQMLASTVQFSNNDQPPVTACRNRPSPGPAYRRASNARTLRHPTACPTPSPLPVPFHAEAVLGREAGQVCRVVNVEVLLRKEVIQPHLPVRLPCYDFVPIASPTFDSSLPQGVGPPASGVTDFRDVTGGVYKARERIHRSNADLRLLATPTSWGRVADPNPN